MVKGSKYQRWIPQLWLSKCDWRTQHDCCYSKHQGQMRLQASLYIFRNSLLKVSRLVAGRISDKMADDDDWGTEEALQAPKAIAKGVVIRDYIPEHNEHLTLILDDTVYVFDKNTGAPGFWLGETNGLCGLFPAAHVKIVEEAGKGGSR